ncbi:MAG: hypothetical protein JNN11_01885 [Candidatus Doudnabacteria bacterium]|nr:hypothetical protein [Candidatus Doudnabacteria bacterium]
MENQVPKKTIKSFWPMVLISAVSFLVGGFLVWAAYNQGLEEQLNSLLPGNQRVQRENAERLHNQAATETADWKTYRNDEYGFEFKYPEDWYISTKAIDEIKRGSSDLVVLLTNAPEEKEQRYVEELKAYDGIGASENHVDLLNGNLILITAHDLSVEYFKDFKKELGFEFKNIIDLNHSVGKGVRGNWYITWEMFKDTDAVYLPFNGSMNNQWGRPIKSISFWIDRNNGKYEKEVFEQVVNSFKYTE